jgi:hypothetical protein
MITFCCSNDAYEIVANSTLSRDISIGTVTGYGLYGRGSIPVRNKKFFSTSHHPERFWVPPSLALNGYGGSFPGAKRQGRESDHSPPSNAEAKNSGAIPPLHSLICLHSMVLK